MRRRPARQRSATSERGSAVFELPMVLGLILVPFGLAVLLLPAWVERQTAARDGAAEVARHLVVAAADRNPAAVLRDIEDGYQLEPGSLRLASDPVLVPGEAVTVRVSVALPSTVLPVFGSLGGGSWTATHTERVPDYGEVGR